MFSTPVEMLQGKLRQDHLRKSLRIDRNLLLHGEPEDSHPKGAGTSKKLIIDGFRKSAVKCHPIARARLRNLCCDGPNTSLKWSPDGISFDHASQGECDIFVIDAP
jgi:hypothetical protein